MRFLFPPSFFHFCRVCRCGRNHAGQSITITATLPGGSTGTSPYTYNYLVVNTITGARVANQLYIGVVGTSNSFVFTSNANLVGNTLAANVIITDSATTPETVNSVKTGTITIDQALGTPTITPSAANTLDAGQSITITATLPGGSTGTSPYTYNYLVVNTITGALVANQL